MFVYVIWYDQTKKKDMAKKRRTVLATHVSTFIHITLLKHAVIAVEDCCPTQCRHLQPSTDINTVT